MNPSIQTIPLEQLKELQVKLGTLKTILKMTVASGAIDEETVIAFVPALSEAFNTINAYIVDPLGLSSTYKHLTKLGKVDLKLVTTMPAADIQPGEDWAWTTAWKECVVLDMATALANVKDTNGELQPFFERFLKFTIITMDTAMEAIREELASRTSMTGGRTGPAILEQAGGEKRKKQLGAAAAPTATAADTEEAPPSFEDEELLMLPGHQLGGTAEPPSKGAKKTADLLMGDARANKGIHIA